MDTLVRRKGFFVQDPEIYIFLLIHVSAPLSTCKSQALKTGFCLCAPLGYSLPSPPSLSWAPQTPTHSGTCYDRCNDEAPPPVIFDQRPNSPHQRGCYFPIQAPISEKIPETERGDDAACGPPARGVLPSDHFVVHRWQCWR